MGDRSGIGWTDATWGPVTGCTPVSEGCDHCYIERTPPFRMAHRRFVGDGPGSSAGVMLHPARLDQPLRWQRPRRIFVNSMSDLFHRQIPNDYVARVFAVMAAAERHTFQVLTKRAGRVRTLLGSPSFHRAVEVAARELQPEVGALSWPLPNVWVGVSAETQRWATVSVPILLAKSAAVRFRSCEPLLSQVEVDEWLTGDRRLDWVIAGGESGPAARPMSPRWARLLRDQCEVAAIPFTFKQWGEWSDVEHGLDAAGDDDPLFRRCVGNNRANGHRMRSVESQMMVRLGRHKTGRTLDGRTWDQYPGSAP